MSEHGGAHGAGHIELVEVGPRDGLQSESQVLPTAAKLELIGRLAGAGLKRIEVASFVHPQRVPQMADAESVLAGLPRDEGVQYIGLVLNRRGFERAHAAGCTEIGMVVAATDSFGRRNQGATGEETLRAWEEIAPLAHAAGIRAQVTISVAFGCPFEGEVPVERGAEFLEFFDRDVGMTPVWMCPLRAGSRWPLYPLEPGKLYVNFGFWGMVPLPRGQFDGYHNRLIETAVHELDGHKSLYSTSFYGKDEFWRLYNGDVYWPVKREYDPSGRLLDLYDKCVRGR